jgi:hypothetical protein
LGFIFLNVFAHTCKKFVVLKPPPPPPIPKTNNNTTTFILLHKNNTTIIFLESEEEVGPYNIINLLRSINQLKGEKCTLIHISMVHIHITIVCMWGGWF